MATIGFHASHEQIHPAQLLADVQHAEAAGFQAAMCSDHFSPWSERQGHSGYAWSWLGAALATTSLPIGVVTAPGQRYHPAIAAQKIGTLAAMFSGRFWAALGSGQNLNEHITGEGWPRKELRQQRLRECADIIRRLLDGELVSHQGLVTVDRARLWTLPDVPPKLLAPAVSPGTAGEAAEWADGVITINQHFDLVSAEVSPETLESSVYVSNSCAEHAERLHELVELGFDEIYLHHVGQEQRAFLDRFGADVLPQLRTAGQPAAESAAG